jgi:hypothetical protein
MKTNGDWQIVAREENTSQYDELLYDDIHFYEHPRMSKYQFIDLVTNNHGAAFTEQTTPREKTAVCLRRIYYKVVPPPSHKTHSCMITRSSTENHS